VQRRTKKLKYKIDHQIKMEKESNKELKENDAKMTELLHAN